MMNTSAGESSEAQLHDGAPRNADSATPEAAVDGVLFIGDPHLEARVPGFRSDNYPDVAIAKLRWCLNYAQANRLQPFLLGDLFQLPQDNPNWLLAEIIDSLSRPLFAIYGNHDVRENSLKSNDSINVLFQSGHLKRLSDECLWSGDVRGRRVIVGGTAWGDRLPKRFDRTQHAADLVVWLTHHDILIPGYEEGGRIRPTPIDGIDLIVNGHIHRRLPTVVRESTTWMTPGNIIRRSRSDASRKHRPAVLILRPALTGESTDNISSAGREEPSGEDPSDRLLVRPADGSAWIAEWVTVPHQPFNDVFHEQLLRDEDDSATGGSGFIADLSELVARRTDTGAGLKDYLRNHLSNYEQPVADEIRRLAREVIDGEKEVD